MNRLIGKNKLFIIFILFCIHCQNKICAQEYSDYESRVFAGEIDQSNMPKVNSNVQAGFTLAIFSYLFPRWSVSKANSVDEIEEEMIEQGIEEEALYTTKTIPLLKYPRWRVSCMNSDNEETIYKGNVIIRIDKDNNLNINLHKGFLRQIRNIKYAEPFFKKAERMARNSLNFECKKNISLSLKVKNHPDIFNKQILFLRKGTTKEQVVQLLSPKVIENDCLIGEITSSVENTFFDGTKYILLKHIYGLDPANAQPFK